MQVTLDWGPDGAARARDAAVLVVVDVLSFTTALDVACSAGAEVIPFALRDRAACQHEADRLGALCARRRKEGGPSLSPPTLAALAAGTRLLLPSPNGARIAAERHGRCLLGGCLRNASAVAEAARDLAGDGEIALIAAGERWPDGTMRVALEDQIGAGALAAALGGAQSVEARFAAAGFRTLAQDLEAALTAIPSGIELTHLGFACDVHWAAAHDVSRTVPILRDGRFSAL